MRLYDILAALVDRAGPEYYTQSGWTVLKYPNGAAICYRNVSFTTNITNKAGSIYYYYSNGQSLPSGLFIESPRMFANCDVAGAQWAQVQEIHEETYRVKLYYPESYPTTIAWPCQIFAIGRWK